MAGRKIPNKWALQFLVFTCPFPIAVNPFGATLPWGPVTLEPSGKTRGSGWVLRRRAPLPVHRACCRRRRQRRDAALKKIRGSCLALHNDRKTICIYVYIYICVCVWCVYSRNLLAYFLVLSVLCMYDYTKSEYPWYQYFTVHSISTKELNFLIRPKYCKANLWKYSMIVHPCPSGFSWLEKVNDGQKQNVSWYNSTSTPMRF